MPPIQSAEQFIQDIVHIYPHPLKRFLQKSSFTLKQPRFAYGEKIDGSYDIETGEIILWDPNLQDQEGLFLVITHEWGHKIYHEWCHSYDIEEWLVVRSLEKIDFDLKKTYPAVKQPEEEYCTLFSLISLAKYWNKKDMKISSRKLNSKLKSKFPLTSRVIEKHIIKKSTSTKNAHCHITHNEVVGLKAWVHKVIGD